MESSKISVIVPVYKVEPYLRKCLDSIANQTYKNLEIILVDDGSPDNCGAICDEYAAKDERITVIHQKNGGLSAARNAGLDIATGELIGFIDSDDWMELDTYEYLLTNMLKENADIACCGRIIENPNRSVGDGWPTYEVLDIEAALKSVLEDRYLHNYVTDKLYKRELFKAIRFPVEKTFEDVATSYKVFANANKVLCLPGNKYHYLLRKGSIIADTKLSNRVNMFFVSKQRYEDMAPTWPQLAGLLETRCIASAVHLWSVYVFNPKEEQIKYIPLLKTIASNAKPCLKITLEKASLGLAGRMVLHLVPYATWWSFYLAGFIGWLYKLKHGRIL